jgi:penicillin amidase
MATWMSPVVPQKFDYKNFAGVPQANASEVLYLPVNMNRGTQNHMVVFKKTGFEAQNVCPPGQSGFVAPDGTKDPHYEDQMELYQNFQSKPMILNYHP